MSQTQESAQTSAAQTPSSAQPQGSSQTRAPKLPDVAQMLAQMLGNANAKGVKIKNRDVSDDDEECDGDDECSDSGNESNLLSKEKVLEILSDLCASQLNLTNALDNVINMLNN